MCLVEPQFIAHESRCWLTVSSSPGTDETAQGRIFDTHASGQELLLKIADGPNVADPISLSFKLTGKDEAEVMPLVDQQGDVPPPKKPWHFQRVSDSK